MTMDPVRQSIDLSRLVIAKVSWLKPLLKQLKLVAFVKSNIFPIISVNSFIAHSMVQVQMGLQNKFLTGWPGYEDQCTCCSPALSMSQ